MRVPSFAYSVYSHILAQEVQKGPLPRHIGVIIDGNRRYARERGYLDIAQGHQAGADKIDEFLEWCAQLSIPIVTIWAFSTENFGRDSYEVVKLLSIIEAKVQELAHSPRIKSLGYRIQVLGKRSLLPSSLRMALEDAEERTRGNSNGILNIAVGYGGRQEILDAVTALFRDRYDSNQPLGHIDSLTPADLRPYLYTGNLPDPDLIIRTSGEVRLSGFLLWQSAYSEFYFCDAFWPAFRKIDFLRAVRSYQQRQRRFGGSVPIPAEPREDERPQAMPNVYAPQTPPHRAPPVGWSPLQLFVERIQLQTDGPAQFVDITDRVLDIARRSGVRIGEVRLYCPHTSAGLTINEQEPLLLEDMASFLNRVASPAHAYRHNDFTTRTVNMTERESPDGHSHCQRLMLNTSEVIPVIDGELLLGRWQRIFLVELDNARPREVVVWVNGG